jgi:hypothetical protein
MTGFKSGASSDDPLGGGDGGGDPDETEAESTSSSIRTGRESDLDATEQRDGDEESETPAATGLPWIYDRDSITDGRAKTVQLHLQDSTLEQQREARADVESALGESVKKADLREAALLVGFAHLDEVGDQLREWGYDWG